MEAAAIVKGCIGRLQLVKGCKERLQKPSCVAVEAEIPHP